MRRNHPTSATAAGYLAVVFLSIVILAAIAPRVLSAPRRQSPASTAVQARFDLSAPENGPFPSDWFTVDDATQNTGRRVELPLPDCVEFVSGCEDVAVLNTLDGFNLQPRLSLPFDAQIDVASVTSRTVFLINLGDTLDRRRDGASVVGINQIVWDAATTTLHVQSDVALDQHTRYALIATTGIRDDSGAPIGATDQFRRFRHEVRSDYKQALLEAVAAARKIGVREEHIATASVFTTQSATAWLEKVRDRLHARIPSPADFVLGPQGARTVFALNDVTSIVWRQQRLDSPPGFTDIALNLSLLRDVPGAVGQVAFGKYRSPDFMVHPGEYIPSVGTRSGVPKAHGVSDIYFNLYLPSGPEPLAGWPVVIFGHGSGLSKQGAAIPGTGSSLAVAASLAARGFATLAIDAVGHGFGALSTLTVTQAGASSVTFPAGGRGMDQNHDGQIGTSEGLEAASPRRLQLVRDGVLQTVADLVQLVRVVQTGVDVDDDGRSDLDHSRIFWLGQSLGGAYGIDLFAVEPAIRAAVFNVPFGVFAENRRLPAGSRPLLGAMLATRIPSLLNPPGVIGIDGVPVSGPNYFHENLPLRDGVAMTVALQNGAIEEIRSPAINTAAGALQLQTWADRAAWAGHASDPIAYASHLGDDPLAGMPVRPVLIGFAKGDRQVFNANTTNILRAGALTDRSTFFRNDLAFAENPAVPKDPHGFMTRIDIPVVADIARGIQQQIATFFDSDGTTVIHPEPSRFFEMPVSTPLPEGLAYIP